jgi:tRNA threonylcarbamoyladenosine biosynthesis protein TsaE
MALGGKLAAVLPSRCIVYLYGDLGAGKTTLVRGLLKAVGLPGPVKSPTYTLIEPYQIQGRCFYHLDLYRLADPEELEYLGVRDLLEHAAVLLVEWPDKGRGLLPAADLEISLCYHSGQRKAMLEARSGVGAQVLQRLKVRTS